MSKQTELVGLARTTTLDEVNAAYSAGALSNRNLIINGAMQVAQRGTSGGVTTSYTYMLDRWLANGGITSWAQTGAQKSVLQVVTQAGTGPAQRIESNGANFVSGNTYTLSFQVNPTIADVTVGVTFRNGNSYLSEIVAVTDVSSQVVAGSYSTVTYTFTLSSSADIVTYPSHNMQVFIGSSVVNTLNITNVQLEVGDTATPFEHRSYGQELALCQRYYFTTWPTGTALGTNIVSTRNLGVAMAGNAIKVFSGGLALPVEMRATPSVSTRSPTGLTGKYYVQAQALDFTFNYGAHIWAGPKYIGLDEYDAGASASRAGYTHLFCDAEL